MKIQRQLLRRIFKKQIPQIFPISIATKHHSKEVMKPGIEYLLSKIKEESVQLFYFARASVGDLMRFHANMRICIHSQKMCVHIPTFRFAK